MILLLFMFFRGTDKQIEKNKRKCVHLKEEIENIKVWLTLIDHFEIKLNDEISYFPLETKI